MLYAQLARTQRYRLRAASGNDGERYAAFLQQLHAVAVEYGIGFHLLAAVGEIKPAIGEHAIDVASEQSYRLRPLAHFFGDRQGGAKTHRTFARNKSCRCKAPINLPA